MKIDYIPELDVYRVGKLITTDKEFAEAFLRSAEKLAEAGRMLRNMPEPKSRQVFAECVNRK